MKICCTCRIEKPNACFYRRGKTGLSGNCISCNRLHNQQNYLKKKSYYAVKAEKDNLKKQNLVRAAKNRPCNDCGINYEFYIMQFDHIRDKDFNIGHYRAVGIKRLVDEIAKCEVVCANCHAKRTWSRTQK